MCTKHVLLLYSFKYICRTFSCIIYVRVYTCITYVEHIYFRCSIHVWQMCELCVIFSAFQCWLQLIVFHLKWDFLSTFVSILIILNLSLWLLYYTVKLWNARLWTSLGCYFTCYQQKFNLLKSSFWICHLKVIEMYRKLDRKSPFTSAATWWSSTLESGEYQNTIHVLHVYHTYYAMWLISIMYYGRMWTCC